jgi:hypothetical protein
MPIKAALSNTFGFRGTNEHKELESSDVDIREVTKIRVTNFFKKYLTKIKIPCFKIMLLLFETF